MSIRHTNYPLVSIVVPCYNAELTIESCLDSLLSQGFQRLEIICVNDGSKDKTADILDSYRLRYPEVIVVNQKTPAPGWLVCLAFKRPRATTLCF